MSVCPPATREVNGLKNPPYLPGSLLKFPALSLKLTLTREAAIRFEVRAKPRARKSAVVGVQEGALVVQLAAPPVDGAANEELIATLARALGIPKRDVAIVRGDSARHKLVEVRGPSERELRVRLDG